METIIGDYIGTTSDHYRDPFPHSLLSTRQSLNGLRSWRLRPELRFDFFVDL